MRKTKDILLASGEVVFPGEMVRYYTTHGWHIGMLVKQAGKRLAIKPMHRITNDKERRNAWVAIADVEKLPPESAHIPASKQAVFVEF